MMIQTPTFLLSTPLPALRVEGGALLSGLLRRLIEGNRRASERRRLEDLPDRLRADAGLPPRPPMEEALRSLTLRAALLR